MWRLSDSNTLKNKASDWNSNDQWKLKQINDNFFIIENLSNGMVLGTENGSKVVKPEEAKETKEKTSQMWEKGNQDSEGYFVLVSVSSKKALTAHSSDVLEIKGTFLTLHYSFVYREK